MVKKFAKLPDLSASPETSSMTIKLIKYIIFTHYNINIIIYVSLSLKKCKVHIKLVLESTRCRKHDKMFYSLSAETVFSISKVSPLVFQKFCFFASFCINVVFPQLVCPIMKIIAFIFFVVVAVPIQCPSSSQFLVFLKISCFFSTNFSF